MADHIELLPVETLVRDPGNARTHSKAQVQALANSMRDLGFYVPIVINADNKILAGHGRLDALELLGHPLAPCIRRSNLTPAQEKALAIADNRLGELSEWDIPALRMQVLELQAVNYDLPNLGIDHDFLAHIFNANSMGAGKAEARQKLADRFGAPPFSVLDTRQGYWTERRRAWLQLTGNLSATKVNVLDSAILSQINQGSSNFDPVLAEIMMAWFCPRGGSVLDPFGGEQTKGVVAGELGLRYHAVEYRADQVEINRAACAEYPLVQYQCGDSEGIAKLYPARDYNLCFTSPPYYDLEIYSKDDMSALGTYAEFMKKYRRIFAACTKMLAENAFLVVKVGEIRDRDTGMYRNFVGDNIAMFISLGLHYYNELSLINSAGTAPQRAGKSFGTRKMVKVHQNVLVFVKGDVGKAVAALGEPWRVDMDMTKVDADDTTAD
jgi:hypothetical protein